MKIKFSLDGKEMKAALELYINAHFGLPDGGTFNFPTDYTWTYTTHEVEYDLPEVTAPTAVEPTTAEAPDDDF